MLSSNVSTDFNHNELSSSKERETLNRHLSAVSSQSKKRMIKSIKQFDNLSQQFSMKTTLCSGLSNIFATKPDNLLSSRNRVVPVVSSRGNKVHSFNKCKEIDGCFSNMMSPHNTKGVYLPSSSRKYSAVKQMINSKNSCISDIQHIKIYPPSIFELQNRVDLTLGSSKS